MNISIKSFENADPDSAVKAHVTMTIDNAFVVKNLAVVQGKNGMFVNMPHHKSNEVGEDGKAVYKDDAFPLSKDLRDKIRDAAIESYENGGKEVAFDHESAKGVQERNPFTAEKEGARQDRPSVLKELSTDKHTDMDKPIKITRGSVKDAVGETR